MPKEYGNTTQDVVSGDAAGRPKLGFRASFLIGHSAFVFVMTSSLALRVAAIFGFLAVALGAFGAHSLKGVLAQNQTAAIWETAAHYHLAHAIVLLVLAYAARDRFPSGPFLCFAVGTVIFSGSLYALAATNIRWLGAITPVGGLSLLAGWLWLALAW